MSATFSDALLRHLDRLLAGSESVSDFKHWFSKAWWESESSAADEVADFASDIEHYTYILDSGVWDEAEFLRELRTATNVYSDSRIQAKMQALTS